MNACCGMLTLPHWLRDATLLGCPCRIAPDRGSETMDGWEGFFREKSKRRWARHSRETAVKRAILLLLLGSVAAAIYLQAAGLPR
jgi:hypothetical protein